MIQRIQSLYLLLGAMALLALLLFDLAWTSPAAEYFAWFTPSILLLAAIVGLGAIGAIFLYSDRRRQKRAVVGIQYATIIFMLILFGSMYFAGDLHFMRGGETAPGKIVAMAMPLVGYIFFFLARRGIVKDIELVRSMDRLR